MAAKKQHILIIGGGLGGLLLAQSLKKAGDSNISFHVYERDESFMRAQGYRIRLNHDGGYALKQLLPPHLWLLFLDTCATLKEGFSKFDALTLEPIPMFGPGAGAPGGPNGPNGPTGGPSGPSGPSGSSGGFTAPKPGGGFDFVIGKREEGVELLGPFSVDRTTLRRLLLIGLEDHVSFNKSLIDFKIDESKKSVTAFFKDGTQAEGTLLVGADGVRSRVRRTFLPNHKLADTTGRIIYGKTPITAEFSAVYPQDALKNITILGPANDKIIVFSEPMRFTEKFNTLPRVPDYIYWVLCTLSHKFNHSDEQILSSTPAQAAQHSLSLTSGWHSSLRALLQHQSVQQSAEFRILSMRPDIPYWETSECVTLLGDAIHAMSPTGGFGANTALKDAQLLSKVILSGSQKELLAVYEAEMRDYAGHAIKGSSIGGMKMFGLPPISEWSEIDL